MLAFVLALILSSKPFVSLSCHITSYKPISSEISCSVPFIYMILPARVGSECFDLAHRRASLRFMFPLVSVRPDLSASALCGRIGSS